MTDFVELISQDARQREGPRESDGHTQQGQSQAVPQDQPQDILTLRSQCHANPYLVAPQRHRMGQNPIQAQGSKPERNNCKQPQQR